MIIRLADCPSQLWKNGLGRTRQIAVHPSTTGGSDFSWRVSIAEVDNAAPFSSFPGIDRHIALLDGAGFTMHLDDGQVHALTTPLTPFTFAGELGVTVVLAGGATRDFNLMLNREECSGDLLPWLVPGEYQTESSLVLVYCARGRMSTCDGVLQAGDTWRPKAGSAATVTLPADAAALAVRIRPNARRA